MQSNQRTTPINPQSISHLPLLQAWFLAEETLVAHLPQAETTLLILILIKALRLRTQAVVCKVVVTQVIQPLLAKHG